VDKTVQETVQGRFRVGDLEVDLDRQFVKRDGQLIELPELSFRLLAVLVRRAPDNVSKDDLMQDVWGSVVVGDETLAQRVRLLRQALVEGSKSPKYISSVRGRGYRMICDVTPWAAAEKKSKKHWILRITLAAVLLSIAYLLFEPDLGDEPLPVDVSSIAVLPFADLSPDQTYRYFADGMQDELLTRLAKLDGVEVLSRTSLEVYRTTDLSLPEIASAIGAGSVIEGSIRIADDRVRITVQLINAETDRHMWAESFERELSVQNIFSIQEEVAEKIAQALQLEYKAIPLNAQGAMPTSNIDAYDAYLLGRYHTFRQTPADLALAVNYLETATSLDPEFAEAYASLGWAYGFLGTNYGQQLPREFYPKAKEAALKALSLDSELADARSLYADILTWFDWDFAAAERKYRKTVELDPLNVLGYSLFLSSQQRHDEAIRLVERRLAASPNDSYVHINAAWRFYHARDYARAIEEAMLAGDHTDARSVLIASYLVSGETEQAIELAEMAVRVEENNPRRLANLAYVYFKAGETEKGESLLADLESIAGEQFVSPDASAEVYFAAGDADKGFAMLQKAFDVRTRGMIFLQVNHAFDGYREDPRYQDLIWAIGFQSLQ
jgi:TolB-like protein/DNA-binding winged helix-turn-helix (wHTH) protein/Tfp pilus assembly protein PilF